MDDRDNASGGRSVRSIEAEIRWAHLEERARALDGLSAEEIVALAEDCSSLISDFPDLFPHPRMKVERVWEIMSSTLRVLEGAMLTRMAEALVKGRASKPS